MAALETAVLDTVILGMEKASKKPISQPFFVIVSKDIMTSWFQ